jgi:hypothetical protein
VLSAIVIVRRPFGVRSKDVQGGRYRHPAHVVRVPDDLVDRQVCVGAPIWCYAWYLWKHRKNGYTEFMRLVSALPSPQRVVHANLINDYYQQKGGGEKRGRKGAIIIITY